MVVARDEKVISGGCRVGTETNSREKNAKRPRYRGERILLRRPEEEKRGFINALIK